MTRYQNRNSGRRGGGFKDLWTLRYEMNEAEDAQTRLEAARAIIALFGDKPETNLTTDQKDALEDARSMV